jgi:hypothetical protein
MAYTFSIAATWIPGPSILTNVLMRATAEGKRIDNLIPLFQRAQSSAIKGELRDVMKRLKAAIINNRFGWDEKRRHPLTGEVIQAVATRYPSKRRDAKKDRRAINAVGEFYGKVRKLFFYQYDRNDNSARIGIIPGFLKTGKSAEELAVKLATGGDVTVTPKVRGYMSALGLPISRSILSRPARPLVGALWQEEGSEIMRKIEDRFIERLFSY